MKSKNRLRELIYFNREKDFSYNDEEGEKLDKLSDLNLGNTPGRFRKKQINRSYPFEIHDELLKGYWLRLSKRSMNFWDAEEYIKKKEYLGPAKSRLAKLGDLISEGKSAYRLPSIFELASLNVKEREISFERNCLPECLLPDNWSGSKHSDYPQGCWSYNYNTAGKIIDAEREYALVWINFFFLKRKFIRRYWKYKTDVPYHKNYILLFRPEG